MANLVIVESPSKASTIKGYLGSNYKVMASVGHVRDLPKSSLGVDIDNHFEAHYINIRGKGDLIKDLKKEAKNANKIFLATDPDREGEAISWHLATALGIPVENIQRVTFNEITKSVVKAAIKQPRKLDMNLVDAQQARRILDRIVGYKLSPFLWKTVRSGLSAGRVQSVATKLIVDREKEIRAFKPEEYWTINVTLLPENAKPFVAHFYGDHSGKIRLTDETSAMKVVNAVEGKPFTVYSVKRATKKKHPAPPFTTSTMQQEASRKLGFQSQRIMKVAQELYEGINLGSELGGVQGLITYMRTDSLRVSAEAQAAAESLIREKYGDRYYPASPRVYKTKATAQDAHEAIRPARVDIEPARVRKMLTADQYKLYKLIWERFVASQMESADLETLTVDFDCQSYLFRTSGYTVTFPGYMAVYEESVDDSQKKALADEPEEQRDLRIPTLSEGDCLRSGSVEPNKHFTEAPPRYTEGSMIKLLEEKGIGRPSTFASIISTIISRGYVKREGKSLVPTELGEVTNDIMIANFSTVVDEQFTARMEDSLDEIENGRETLEEVLSGYWKVFEKQLILAESSMGSISVSVPAEKTEFFCDKCGAQMVVKNGRFGKFAACPNYPTCKSTRPLTTPEKPKAEEKAQTTPINPDMICEACGAPLVLRTGRYGSFYACSKYPECKFTKQKVKDIGVPCPSCGSRLVMKTGRNKTIFYSCEKYPTCDFSSWDMPTKELCPACGKMLFRKKGKPLLVCHDKDCGYSREAEIVVEYENPDE
ncbi:MAG: type I DNA topoisomerase [Ruminococcaceae bacterium]|nr:type I DNA topoisomerase [Oscillospiraceae bacterium]